MKRYQSVPPWSVRLWSVLLYFFSLSASAAPADFARGRILEINGDTVVQRVLLPQDVYEWVVRGDLGDLRIFDAQNVEVPYALRRPASEQEYSPWQSLPVFVLPVPEADNSTPARVDIELGESGAVVAVRGGAGAGSPGAGFLIDASHYSGQIAELKIGSDPGPDGFIGKFRVESSDDLNSWRTVVADSTLARLETQGQQVLVDSITLPDVAQRYLRITQRSGIEQLSIESVSVRSRQLRLPERHWKQLLGIFTDNGYEFDDAGQFPLDRINVVLDQPSYLITARLLSRAADHGAWRSRGQHRFYRVAMNGTLVQADPVVFSVPDRYWRVELLDDSPQPPLLRVGWLPDELLFLTQGKAPFMLAYGQAGIVGRQWPIADILSRLDADVKLDQLPLATLSPAQELGGAERREPAPEPVNWRKLILWTLLIMGVGIVSLFAYRITRASLSQQGPPRQE